MLLPLPGTTRPADAVAAPWRASQAKATPTAIGSGFAPAAPVAVLQAARTLTTGLTT